jgi:hypothetical protein
MNYFSSSLIALSLLGYIARAQEPFLIRTREPSMYRIDQIKNFKDFDRFQEYSFRNLGSAAGFSTLGAGAALKSGAYQFHYIDVFSKKQLVKDDAGIERGFVKVGFGVRIDATCEVKRAGLKFTVMPTTLFGWANLETTSFKIEPIGLGPTFPGSEVWDRQLTGDMFSLVTNIYTKIS